jgi:hypothetical protein
VAIGPVGLHIDRAAQIVVRPWIHTIRVRVRK